jgi:hypothetical protein
LKGKPTTAIDRYSLCAAPLLAKSDFRYNNRVALGQSAIRLHPAELKAALAALIDAGRRTCID